MKYVLVCLAVTVSGCAATEQAATAYLDTTDAVQQAKRDSALSVLGESNVARLEERRRQQPQGMAGDNAYGPGTGMDQYGRAYSHDPHRKVQPNAYGMGVGMDQYGHPVQHDPIAY